ncbi:unnamed protein product, partial [Prunus brigantina]
VWCVGGGRREGCMWERSCWMRSESPELIDECLWDAGLLCLMKCHGLEGILNGGDVGVEAMLLFYHQCHRIMEVIELGDNLFLLQFKL